MSSEADTNRVLTEMLVENTGVIGGDSGGYPMYNSDGKYIGSQQGYGRSFERNVGIDWEKVQPTDVEFSIRGGTIDIEVTHNLYHFLSERLRLSELDELFHGKFLSEEDPKDLRPWMELMYEFPTWLGKQFHPCEDCHGAGECGGGENEDEDSDIGECTSCSGSGKGEPIYPNIGGIYGEGDPYLHYTYNSDNLLSQDIQYLYFTTGHRGSRDEYVILQIHGGADARTGMTKPRVFEMGQRGEHDLFDFNNCTIYCSGKDHHPSAETLRARQESQSDFPGIETKKINFEHCNQSWYSDSNVRGFNNNENYKEVLDKLPVKDLSSKEDPCADNPKPNDWEPGVLCVDTENKIAYCPHCGARLGASS